MIGSYYCDLISGESSGEEAERATNTPATRPLSAAEEKAAKRAKEPATNPFYAIRERMNSHRAARAASGAPAPEATANEAAVEDPAQAMLTLANIERARAPKMKEPSKSGAHTSGKRLSVEPGVSV